MANLLFNAENVRMLAIMVFVTCGYVLTRSQMKSLKYQLSKRIDDVDHKIDRVESSLNAKIDRVENSLNAKIDGVENSLLRAIDEKIDSKINNFHTQLKTNDFAHLNATIQALTFTLEKNKFLTPEDKAYVDGRLDK